MGSIIDCFHFLWSPRVKARIKEHLVHLKLYEARLGELKAVIHNLKKARYAVDHKVKEEEYRYDRGIPRDVEEWIKAVSTTISEYDKFNQDEDHELAAFDLFTTGYLPKTGIRYRLSKKALDITRTVNQLLQKANHETFSYWLGPPSMVDFFDNISYDSFPSREETMKKIKEALKNPNVRMIGLHGLSGVGKTTLVKEIAREASEASETAKVFDVVVMANVTRNPGIRKIQGQIADALGMKLDEESNIARAARIRKRLKNKKESTLIILDDLWASLDFNMLGIPLSNHDDDREHSRTKATKETPSGNVKGKKNPEENSKNNSVVNMMKSTKLPSASRSSSVKTGETLNHYKGCKVLLISESKQVLLSQMEGKENFIYFVEVLKEKEAETFFKKMAGIGDGKSEFDKLTAQIASKCNGLPMSIVTTARALKNQSRSVWEDVHRQLERGNLTGASDFSAKLSYGLLEDEELKYAFLLCARMGPDALIMDLVKYCIGLGFLQEIYTIKEARDRVNALVGKLKVSGLLSDSYSSEHFTMQDIVRSAALSIASKEKSVFTRTKGKIDEWPDKLERIYNSEDAASLKAKLESCLKSIYEEYSGGLVSPLGNSTNQSAAFDEVYDDPYGCSEFYQTVGCSSSDNELSQYIQEDIERRPLDFDILAWWKVNSSRFPILASIAREVLAIPISTVASESAFSTGGRILDPYRSSLTPTTVEALVCTQDWLEESSSSYLPSDDFEFLEQLEQELPFAQDVASCSVSLALDDD